MVQDTPLKRHALFIMYPIIIVAYLTVVVVSRHRSCGHYDS